MSVFHQQYLALHGKNANVQDPGAGGTFKLDGIHDGIAIVTATGTYTLPDEPRGTKLTIIADDTSTVTVADGDGSIGSFIGTTNRAGAVCTKMADLGSNKWSFSLVGNAVGEAATISIADAGAYTALTNVESAFQELHAMRFAGRGLGLTTINNTDGTGTLTAAAIVAGAIKRTGETTAYTDTTATGTQIRAGLGSGLDTTNATVASWPLLIHNAVAFTQTLSAGTDVTLAGNSVIPANSVGVFRVDIPDTTAVAVTITGLGSFRQCALPNGQYNTTAAASPVTPAAGILTGANHVFYEVTTDGAFGITTRTATEMFGDIPNCHIGYTYLLTFVNRGNNTVTITAGANVTITASENTLATTTTRTYLVNFTSATACTWTSLVKGTIE
jgi:hypothetical protein